MAMRQQDEKLASLDEKLQAQSDVIRFQRKRLLKQEKQILEQGRRIDVLEKRITEPKQEVISKPLRHKINGQYTGKILEPCMQSFSSFPVFFSSLALIIENWFQY